MNRKIIINDDNGTIKIVAEEYENLNERLSKFHIIKHIPEFKNNQRNPFFIRFENMDDVDEYLDIMIDYCKIALHENLINNINEMSYDVIFSEPGWYIGFANNSILDKNIEYRYEYDTQFNEMLKNINSYLSTF